ncbi:MAG: HlyD family efflux transporter periplasmic adaptor subunit [Acidobacteriaceae bacterium]|nr:HlyD family efflux transporter periplasmic adaptor subunit [Acidobacteriaceae bacterium]
MANSFHRTNLSLERDHGRVSAVILTTGLLLVGGWITWAARAHVTRYETSDSARLEVTAAAYPVQAGISGRLITNRLVLGREVQAGEVLVEIDSRAEQLSLDEERTRAAAFEPQLAALRSQMEAEGAGGQDERRALNFSVDQAKAQLAEAEAQAALAAKEAARAENLRKEGIIADAEVQRAETDAQSKRASVENMRAALSRLAPEQAAKDTDRDVKLRALSEQIAKLQADWTSSLATLRRLQYEVERRKIRAPVSGRLGECAVLRPGSQISEGQQLGVILPAGRLQITAEFQPSAALGKLRPGQPATMRLQGFPWAQYGTVPAKVVQVASEIRDGKVRVELAVNGAAPAKIPLQHGLPGSVEIAIERVTPLALIMRSAGDLVGAH